MTEPRRKPEVSYVVPCYNCEDYIVECLRSIFAQDSVCVEAVVIDDGSCDKSVQRVREYINSNTSNKVSLYFHQNNQNRGVSASRLLGVMHAEGDIIGFLDADDILIDIFKTFRQLSIFSEYPDVVLVHSGIKVIGDVPVDALSHEHHFSQRSILGSYSLFSAKSSLEVNCIANSTVLVKKSCLPDFAFNQLFQVEDFALWHLVACTGNFYCLQDSFVGYRYHDASASAVYNKSFLTRLFSSIEFKLALSARTPSSFQAAAALLSLGSDLVKLLAHYSVNNFTANRLPKRILFRIAFFAASKASKLAALIYRFKAS